MRRTTVFLREVMEALGEDRYGLLLEKFGGSRLYIPATAGAHHPLTVQLGQATADLLCSRFAGDTLELPMQVKKRASIAADLAAGMRPIPIARKYNCSVRHVPYIQAEMPVVEDTRQGRLF